MKDTYIDKHTPVDKRVGLWMAVTENTEEI
jgi:hypothetical protein